MLEAKQIQPKPKKTKKNFDNSHYILALTIREKENK
jgi:hypothetical protein